jgi:alkylation response protein AidB-like acyl-CoA dehydrogenase
MNFEHTEERRMLAATLDRFVGDAYSFDVRDKAAGSPEGFDRAVWNRLTGLGTLAALFGEADGGFGGAGFDISVVFESLGRGLVVEPFLGALMVGTALAAAGGETHRELLNRVVEGSAIVALAHDEPGSHYETTRVAARAVREGDGWVLDGAKTAVTQGDQADFLLVSARSGGSIEDERGISLFIVPKDAVGLEVRGYPKVDGGRAAAVTLRGVKLPASAMLGSAGDGYPLLEAAVGRGILALCAEAVGAMEVARNATLDYLRTRKQFGMPIGSFQALQHRMAELLIVIEQARSAVINAAAALELERAPRERALSAAKYTIGRSGIHVAEECIQLHGGIGMTWELPLAHYAKRLVMIDHELGDEDHHLERYIALGRV